MYMHCPVAAPLVTLWKRRVQIQYIIIIIIIITRLFVLKRCLSFLN
jgi:hypothetical protein